MKTGKNFCFIIVVVLMLALLGGIVCSVCILSNFVGGAITVLAVGACRGASEETLKIALMICIVGNVIILATSAFWQKGLSLTA